MMSSYSEPVTVIRWICGTCGGHRTQGSFPVWVPFDQVEDNVPEDRSTWDPDFEAEPLWSGQGYCEDCEDNCETERVERLETPEGFCSCGKRLETNVGSSCAACVADVVLRSRQSDGDEGGQYGDLR